MTDLTTLDIVDPAHLALLRDRLAESAHATSDLDVRHRDVDSPFGPLLVASTARGVARVAFAGEDHEAVLDSLAAALGPRVLQARSSLDDVARELDEYFTGARTSFTTPVDLVLAKGFRREVLGHLREIPYGSTESYAVVATASGSPRAVRAVGTACATNPVPLLVPCHRVVRSDGTPGAYRGGAEAKRWLLALEHAAGEQRARHTAKGGSR
ncbi:methylated-DNA--[protein]-cysteine S-methyltransferase [Arsenicicoccus sp. oral taxon 190]|uniref:methylated-DNA--[protein]-cysteine S-methyltransferase n=1 Tax=Arsenicicoccus sp. oral taxon 190 TaxID=1658671 RepID=UPI00067A0E77|nr:methylated-DNA--[protein]-cysteine S-methyltransferase [Arsenicicoccus sp. oral taxon 190]AKT50427.1 cysteine methyltransferase [Arsenicicoccus sp. oral taxon 190]